MEPQPPNPCAAAAIDPAEELRAKVPAVLNHTTALRRVSWLPIAFAASMIHWALVTPGGSPATASALAHSASIIGFEDRPATFW